LLVYDVTDEKSFNSESDTITERMLGRKNAKCPD